MEESPFDPELQSLEEMIVSEQWSISYADDDSEPDDDEVILIPQIPYGFRPAA